MQYHRLVTAEDGAGQLLPAMRSVCPLRGIRVVEVGVGTGRLTQLLLRGGVREILGIDTAPAMLQVARDQLASMGEAATKVQLQVGDAAQIPFGDDVADLFVAGWAFGHATSWSGARWRTTIDRYLGEASRVTRPGGIQIVIETLGTGVLHASPPTPALDRYYAHLEGAHGFRREEIATDYAFDTIDEAIETCAFFFGEALVARIRDQGWSRVPEWTGLWWRPCPGASG